MKMISFSGKRCRCGIVYVLLVAVVMLSGCAWMQEQYSSVHAKLAGDAGNAAPLTNTAPTLSTVSASPNPTVAGKPIILTAKYDDPEADLQQGLAAISINGAKPLTIAFRTVYPSGLLTLSVPITPYARASNLNMALKIRDDAGNWSNLVSTVVTVE
ncbi:hypothetical protein U14_03738 [Candidatus Moduliflexus flocculans]|uniref:Lipoprotein n=1 Tax=Candidatus Moduliflexus flocculans TaxID=1499966 RepID=A0A081BQ21_9BACT|nr:hypothetical protein U14_03738 [Candidatus Moduliflexus flocculans]